MIASCIRRLPSNGTAVNVTFALCKLLWSPRIIGELWKEKNASWIPRSPKPRITVLARASSNSPDRPLSETKKQKKATDIARICFAYLQSLLRFLSYHQNGYEYLMQSVCHRGQKMNGDKVIVFFLKVMYRLKETTIILGITGSPAEILGDKSRKLFHIVCPVKRNIQTRYLQRGLKLYTA
jgi:hypothetical protein